MGKKILTATQFHVCENICTRLYVLFYIKVIPGIALEGRTVFTLRYLVFIRTHWQLTLLYAMAC